MAKPKYGMTPEQLAALLADVTPERFFTTRPKNYDPVNGPRLIGVVDRTTGRQYDLPTSAWDTEARRALTDAEAGRPVVTEDEDVRGMVRFFYALNWEV